MTRTRACILLVLIATLLAHGRIVCNGFTGWDDPHTIVENPRLNPPTFANMLHYWMHFAAGLYVPVTYTIWSALAALGHASGGATLRAWPFHLASLVAHGASATMAFLILRRLLDGRDGPACIGAILFAVHPVQVEAVAWTSGLKDVLAGAFALAAAHQYLVSVSSRRRQNYVIAIACFVLAMLSKPSAVVILPMIATIDWLLLRRSLRDVAIGLLPFALLAIPPLVVANRAQETGGIATIPVHQRFLVAADSLAFYLWKIVWPVNLGFDYGRTPQVALESGAARVTWIVPAMLAVAIAVTRSRWLAAAALLFVFGLCMNLGLARFQFQFYSTVADHYLYLAMLGPALMVAWVVSRATSPRGAVVAQAFGGAVLATLIVFSFRQAGLWKDSVTLFTHAVEVNPDSAGAHNNLGRALAERGAPGDLEVAQREFLRVLQIAPYDPSARRNLALLALKYGDLDAGIANLAKSIELNERIGEPVAASDYRELARLLIQRRRAPEAVPYIQRGLAVNPNDPQLRQMQSDLNR